MLFAHAQNARAGEVHQLTPFVRRIIAPNPGPYTFTGTCTYLVGRSDIAIIDPGPLHDDHINAIKAASEGQTIRHICVTHTHLDHSPAAHVLKAMTNALIVGCAPIEISHPHLPEQTRARHDLLYAPDAILSDGQRVVGKSYTFTAIETPGHASNHLCFAFAEEQSLFSGDHVMGWSTSLIAPPDGQLRAYMASLRRLQGRAENVYWPGHGDGIIDPQRKLAALIAHRLERERAICACLEAGEHLIDDMVASIYRGLDPALLRGAAMSVLAHMEDLVDRQIVRCSDQTPLLSSSYKLAPI
jgi:glyoxylase-like metal-dependent hydrolase (beta-lactamase superfamily II)